MLEQILEDLKIPQYLVCNDGYLPVKASARGGVGVAYNCGTGVCCAGIDRDGRLVNVAGLDEWSDDAGSGRWIVLSMFQKVYASAIRKEQETGLVRTFREEFSAWSKEDILNLVYKIPRSHRLSAGSGSDDHVVFWTVGKGRSGCSGTGASYECLRRREYRLCD